MTVCCVAGCASQARARRLCHAHYGRWKRGTSAGHAGILERDYEQDLFLSVPLRPDAWLADAACRDVDTAVFYPGTGQSTEGTLRGRSEGSYEMPRAVCAPCRVQADCLAEALTWEPANGVYGYRGGRTPQERRVMLRGAR